MIFLWVVLIEYSIVPVHIGSDGTFSINIFSVPWLLFSYSWESQLKLKFRAYINFANIAKVVFEILINAFITKSWAVFVALVVVEVVNKRRLTITASQSLVTQNQSTKTDARRQTFIHFLGPQIISGVPARFINKT